MRGARERGGGWAVSSIFPAIAPSPNPVRLIFATSLLSESLAQFIPKNPIIFAQGFNVGFYGIGHELELCVLVACVIYEGTFFIS